MNSIGERLRSVRHHLGLNQDVMAERMGLGSTSWKRLELENRAPKGEVLSQLIEMGYSANWILTGAGEMLCGAVTPTPAVTIDGEFMGLALEAVKSIYKLENARICDRDAGKLAAEIYAEALPLTSGSTDIDDRKAAIRVVTVKLRNSLATSVEPLDSKRLA